DGGVHSHIDHCLATLELAQAKGIRQCFVHVFTDGRDTAPKSALGFVKKLETHLREKNYGKIASVSGRFYAMDRDQRWERVEKAYAAMVLGKGNFFPWHWPPSRLPTRRTRPTNSFSLRSSQMTAVSPGSKKSMGPDYFILIFDRIVVASSSWHSQTQISPI